MVNLRMTGSVVLLFLSSVLAQPVISSPSEKDLLDDIKTEELTKDAKLLKMVEGKWSRLAWGVSNATKDACSIVKVADAPSGKAVAQIDAKINQISAFAYSLTGLTPGQWYEVSAMIKCENTVGQGTFIQAEYWIKGYASGSIDSEHLVGTVPWTKAVIKFLAPAKDYNMILSFWQFGGPGKSWLDDVRIGKISESKIDISKRRVIDGSFWGMFTCFANYLHQYGKDMKEAGVYWQRQGGSALAPEQQKKAEELGMAFEMCFDGMPAAKDASDPCYPVSNSADYKAYVEDCLKRAGPTIRIWEVFNEPNTRVDWTLPAYNNVMCLAGKTIKEKNPKAIFGTGGFTSPDVGYTEACLKRGADKYLDIVMVHPYGVDEALDSKLYALADMCNRCHRPDMALAINETGFPTWDTATGHPVNDWFVSEKDQAAKVVKLYIQALAHKLSFVTYLAWNDITEPSDQAKNMGLVRVDGSPKPAYYAFKFMTKTIGDRKVAQWSYKNTGTRIYKFTGETPIWMIWNALKDTNVIVDTGKVEVFPCDVMGTKLTVKPMSGRVEWKAGNDPVYLIPAK
jgi:hypothetical protein